MGEDFKLTINRMGRATTGTFRSTPLGIVIKESKVAPAKPLLDYRQAKFHATADDSPLRPSRPRRDLLKENFRTYGKTLADFLP